MTDIPPYLLGRRAALGGLGCAFLVLTLIIGIPMLASYTSQEAEIDDSLRQLAQFRAEVAARPIVEAQLQTLRRRGATAPGFVTAESVALGEADLQRAIKDIAGANGSNVRSAQIGSVEHVGVLDAISIQYDLTVPITRLKPLLYAIETHTPYLFIEQIDIAAPLGWQSASNTASEPKLEVHCTLRAYRWGAK